MIFGLGYCTGSAKNRRWSFVVGRWRRIARRGINTASTDSADATVDGSCRRPTTNDQRPTTIYLEFPTPVNSLPNTERGKRMALNSAPIRITSEIRYIHTSNAMAAPNDP